MSVIDKRTHKRLGAFDENGILETYNEKLISRLRQRFKVDESSEKVEASLKQVFTCKTCGAEFESRGYFLAHCREHKRENN